MKKCNSICIAACALVLARHPEGFFSNDDHHHVLSTQSSFPRFEPIQQQSAKVQPRFSLDWNKIKIGNNFANPFIYSKSDVAGFNPQLDNKTISMLHSYYLHIPKHTNEYLERKDHGIFWSFRLLAQLTFQGDDHRRWYSQFSSRSPWYSLMTKRLFRLMTARHELEGKKTKH